MPTPMRRALRRFSPLPADLDRSDPVGRLIVRQTVAVLSVLAVVAVVVLVGIRYVDAARAAADGAQVAANVGVDNGRRSACITDLRSAETAAANEVNDAVLFRLAVLDGTNPETEQPVASEREQAELAGKYVAAGLEAQRKRAEASMMLRQPKLNDTCGEPAGGAGTAFTSCRAARDAGAAPLDRDSEGWNPDLDADGDGVACENG